MQDFAEKRTSICEENYCEEQTLQRAMNTHLDKKNNKLVIQQNKSDIIDTNTAYLEK